MLFSWTDRKCCKHCQAAGLASRLQLSFFHLSTTVVTKRDFFFFLRSFSLLKLNKFSLFDPQFVRDRWPLQQHTGLFSHTQTTHNTYYKCCFCRKRSVLGALFKETAMTNTPFHLCLIYWIILCSLWNSRKSSHHVISTLALFFPTQQSFPSYSHV